MIVKLLDTTILQWIYMVWDNPIQCVTDTGSH